jgi:hypothetical protein
LTSFSQACSTDHASTIVEPNGPEHEQSTPMVIGVPVAAAAVADPVAAGVLAALLAEALELTAAGDELELLLLDEQALMDTTAANAAATSSTILRGRTMSHFLPPGLRDGADDTAAITAVTWVSLASLNIVNKRSPRNGAADRSVKSPCHAFVTPVTTSPDGRG